MSCAPGPEGAASSSPGGGAAAAGSLKRGEPSSSPIATVTCAAASPSKKKQKQKEERLEVAVSEAARLIASSSAGAGGQGAGEGGACSAGVSVSDSTLATLRTALASVSQPEDDEDGNRILPDDYPDDYINVGVECVEIALEKSATTSPSSQPSPLRPAFTHQIFKRDRFVVGYKNLAVKVSYTRQWRALVEVAFDDALDAAKWAVDEDPAAQVLASGANPLYGKAESMTRDEAVFALWLEEDRAASPAVAEGKEEEVAATELAELEAAQLAVAQLGVAAAEGGRESGGPGTLALSVVSRASASDAGMALLSRAQAMSLWWIETAEQTDATDARWAAYLLRERASGALAGFTTVFSFSNPTREARPLVWRVCQSVVLPPWQRRGLGKAMLAAVYARAAETEALFEVTVEDPCEEFVRLRDVVELELCLRSPDRAFPAPLEAFPQGLVPARKAEAVRRALRLTLKQVQRCYEVLRLHSLKPRDAAPNDEAVAAFRLDVKRRMAHENVEDVRSKPREELKANLRLLYDDLLDNQYRPVLRRVAPSLLPSLS